MATTAVNTPNGRAPSGAEALDARLAERFGALSPAEQRVARFFAQHREEIAFLSAAEIAQQLDTSDATVVRAAQSLGYAGLPELRRELRQALRMRDRVEARPGRRLEEIGDAPEDALDSVISWQIESLEAARRTVRRESFRRAIELLHRAERVVLFGLGPGAAAADYAALRLARFGRQALALTAGGAHLADGLMVMRAGDVLVVQAFGPVSREVDVTLDRAREVGAPAVLITDTLAAELVGRYDVALEAQRSRPGDVDSVATELVLFDALLLGVAGRDRPHARAAGERLTALRARLL